MKRTILIAALLVAFTTASSAAPVTQPPPGPASYTKAQADVGQAEYISNCVDCHGKNLNDGEFGGPPLIGQAFRDKWFDQPASNLVGFVSTTMPPDSPGRIPLGTYTEIVAYILRANGVAESNQELPGDMEALGALTLSTPKTAPPR